MFHRSNLDAWFKLFRILIGKVYKKYEGLIYLAIAFEVWRQSVSPHVPPEISLPILFICLYDGNIIKLPAKGRFAIFKEVLKRLLE